MTHNIPEHEGYGAMHCWYYLLGGKRLTLKQIKDCAEKADYKGWNSAEITKIDRMAEPRRTQDCGSYRPQSKSLHNDLMNYRISARNLAAYRRMRRN